MRALCVLLVLLVAPAAAKEQTYTLRELISVENVRSNPLQGTGLVVGLDGSGDGTPLARRMISNMLARQGLQLKEGDFGAKSIAAVQVTTHLPAFARPGNRIDVTVSTIGDAKSLQGGTLLLTALKGADGKVYATAQGSVTTGAYIFGGANASTQKNHPTVGRVPRGAHIEASVPTRLLTSAGLLRLALKDAGYETARRIAAAINKRFPKSVKRVGGGSLDVRVPLGQRRKLVAFIADLYTLSVKLKPKARVVVDERTGTIVMGGSVRIDPVVVAHGDLSVRVSEKPITRQPVPLGPDTPVLPRTKVDADEKPSKVSALRQRGSTVEELARLLNKLGMSPRGLITILEAIDRAGALRAELVVQ